MKTARKLVVVMVGVVGLSVASVAAQKKLAKVAPLDTSSITEASIRGHMEFLASDAMQGRGSGTADEWRAATYIGSMMRRWGIEPLGENDFYGQSYFVDPEGKFVGEVGDAFKPELIVRDLDMGLIRTVSDRWAFYRDRRPDAYDELVAR